MDVIVKVVRELRLMKDQPADRFYALLLLVLVFVGVSATVVLQLPATSLVELMARFVGK